MYKTLRKPIAVIVLVCFVFCPQVIYALPQGGAVVGGDPNATIKYETDGVTLTVDQNVSRVITDWASFSIGELETVNFKQDFSSWIALNRVTGGNPSNILGKVTAIGRVFLINPNGVVFGANAIVDTAGLLASTLDINNTDFMDGDSSFTFTGPGGSVVNYGTLRTLSQAGGYVALLGSSVKNAGAITADLGRVILAAGEEMTLNLDPAGLISVVVDITTGTSRSDDSEYAAVNNVGEIYADGGEVILTADILGSAFTSAVNNDGIIEANSFQETTEGYVLLKSNQNIELNGTILASGAIDAYAEDNIILGRGIDEITISNFVWEYLSGSRGYTFNEFGYYYGDGSIKVPLSIGQDIGKDSSSPTSGAGTISLPGQPTGLYTIFDTTIIDNMGLVTYFQDADLNPNQLEHIDLVRLDATGTEYGWEDMYGLGDRDFNDAVIDFVKGIQTIQAPDALLNSPNIFLTAENGCIEQISGDIYANNLMLSANTGMSGTASNGGILTHVDNLSALNNASGNIRVSNRGNLTIANLSGVDGLNTVVPGTLVTGYNGITNYALLGGDVNIETEERGDYGSSLSVEAPVDSYGPVIFTAQGNISHNDKGDVTIHNTPFLGPVTNLLSPSHITGFVYENWPDRTVDVSWELPNQTSGYEFTANAGGSYAMAPGSEILTKGADASITADGNVSLALVDVQNAAATITSTNGSIIDALGMPVGDYNVIAHTIQLSAPNGTVESTGNAAIDLGHPYDFSYRWNNSSIFHPDTTKDAYYDPVSDDYRSTGKWSFGTTSASLANGSWWFHVVALEHASTTVASTTEHIGPFVFSSSTPPEEPSASYWEQIEREFRVYYEILDPSQFLSFEPATKIGLYAYHPLTPTDYSAFDDIELDADAYEFIDGNIKSKKQRAPYFGI